MTDSSHTEQTTFILRFLTNENNCYIVNERFLAFVDCYQKNRDRYCHFNPRNLKRIWNTNRWLPRTRLRQCCQHVCKIQRCTATHQFGQSLISVLSLWLPFIKPVWSGLYFKLRWGCHVLWYGLNNLQPILQQSSTLGDIETKHHMLSSWFIRHQMDWSRCQCSTVCSSFTEFKSGTATAFGLESNFYDNQQSKP